MHAQVVGDGIKLHWPYVIPVARIIKINNIGSEYQSIKINTLVVCMCNTHYSRWC